jgi:hypothetical protein
MKIVQSMLQYLKTILAISGFRIDNATVLRSIFMGLSVLLTIYLSNSAHVSTGLALGYFAVSTLAYIGFITLCLKEHGWRKKFITKYGEVDGYLKFEGILAFCFYHNGASIGYLNVVTAGSFEIMYMEYLKYIIGGIVLFGFVIKLWAAQVVGWDIYYWKDMFLGRKISDFVVRGPYKYFANPMYGIGQIQAYGFAIWYGSTYGLGVALLNQSLVFIFFFLVEKKFIQRVYVLTP